MTLEDVWKAAPNGCWRLPKEHTVAGGGSDLIIESMTTSIPAFAAISDKWEVYVPEPSIEPGDVVRVNSISYSGRVEVVSFWRKMAFVKFEDGDVREYPIKNLTLIRKGPKVHTFEGISWEQKYGGYPVPTGSDILKTRDLIGNGKTYTMTLTEEKVEPELDGRN